MCSTSSITKSRRIDVDRIEGMNKKRTFEYPNKELELIQRLVDKVELMKLQQNLVEQMYVWFSFLHAPSKQNFRNHPGD